jgi:hypothetical protein
MSDRNGYIRTIYGTHTHTDDEDDDDDDDDDDDTLIFYSIDRFLRAFLGCTGIQFLVPFLIPLALRASTLYMRPHVSGTERVGFLKQDARGNLVVASLPVNFPFSAFCRSFLVQTSI